MEDDATSNMQIVGNYRLIKKLDCGNFGCAYYAEHLYLENRTAAIKILHSNLASEQKRSEFLQEANILAILNHPHILPILDVGVHQQNTPYLVLEYCPHGSLKQYLRRFHPKPPPLEAAAAILTKIGQALHYAHQKGVVHRDLKPANILFNAQGEPVLSDFGIAVLLEKTTAVDKSGTPAYMAPEQFQGIVSQKSDQFALGCIAYELVTGKRPYLYSRADTITPPSIINSLVPTHIEQAILKALSEKHTERHKDVAAFIASLSKSPKQWLLEGKAFYDLKRFEEALAAYEQAIRLDPNSTEAYTNKGIALDGLKRFEGALAAYEQAIRLDPNSTEAYTNKGYTLWKLRRFEEALTACEQAIHLDPYSARAYSVKGIAFDELKRFEEALAACEQAIRLDPYSAEAYTNKSTTLDDLKRFDEALAAYEQAIRLDPYYARAYNSKGNILNNLQRYEEALAAYEQAIHLDPNLAYVYDNKGYALNDLQRYEEALSAFDQAIRLDPNQAIAFSGKGTALQNLRRYEEAEEAFEKALNLEHTSK